MLQNKIKARSKFDHSDCREDVQRIRVAPDRLQR